MHPPLSIYMFNILYNVMIRLINYERFRTNDDEYLKIDDGMRRGNIRSLQPLHLVFLQKNPMTLPSILRRLIQF
jgi:hypothetical protein